MANGKISILRLGHISILYLKKCGKTALCVKELHVVIKHLEKLHFKIFV